MARLMKARPQRRSTQATLAAMVLAVLPAAMPASARAAKPEGMDEAAVRAWERGDHEAARPLLKRLALEGEPAAMTLLGVMAARGLGGPKNPAIAAAWYIRAANLGYVPAIRALSAAFRRGEGVVRDEARADALDAWARQLSTPRLAQRR